MDDDIIDITDYLERLANDRRSPKHKQKYMTHTVTQGDTAPHLKLVLHTWL